MKDRKVQPDGAAQAEIQRIESLLAGHGGVNQNTVATMQRFLAGAAQRLSEREGICWYHQCFQAVIEDLLSDAGRGDLTDALIDWSLERSGWKARYAMNSLLAP